jgi:type I restriction enzyme S subunit
MDGFAGAIGISESDGKSSPVVHCYTPSAGADARYYAYLLRDLAVSGYVSSLSKGIRERSTAFDAETFRSLVLPVPPQPHQRVIADYLDRETARIDALIAKKQRMIQLFEERRVALIDSTILFTAGPLRPVATLATYINGWPFKPSDFSESGTPVVRITQLTGSSHEQDYYEGNLPERVTLRDGDLVFSWSGSLEVRRWNRGHAYLNQHLFRVLPKDGVDLNWLTHALDCASRLFAEHMHGSAMTHITQPMMKLVKIPVPDVAAQARIASDLDSTLPRLHELRSAAVRQINLLREHRHALITGAVTGEMEIPGVAA